MRARAVQLYEVLDHSTKTKTATSVVSSASPASPPGVRKVGAARLITSSILMLCACRDFLTR